MGDAPFRILPRVNDENRFFWTSGEDGRLRFLRCDDCGVLRPPAVADLPGVPVQGSSP